MSEQVQVQQMLVQNKTARPIQFAVPMNQNKLPDGTIAPTINDHRVLKPGLNTLDKKEFETFFKPTHAFKHFHAKKMLIVTEVKVAGDLLSGLDADAACDKIADCWDPKLLDEIDEVEKRKDVRKAIKEQRAEMQRLEDAGQKPESKAV